MRNRFNIFCCDCLQTHQSPIHRMEETKLKSSVFLFQPHLGCDSGQRSISNYAFPMYDRWMIFSVYVFLCDCCTCLFLYFSHIQTLQRCADAVDYLSNEDYSISAKVDLAKSALLDSIIKKYKDTWLACIEEVSMCSLSIILYIWISIHDIKSMNITRILLSNSVIFFFVKLFVGVFSHLRGWKLLGVENELLSRWLYSSVLRM